MVTPIQPHELSDEVAAWIKALVGAFVHDALVAELAYLSDRLKTVEEGFAEVMRKLDFVEQEMRKRVPGPGESPVNLTPIYSILDELKKRLDEVQMRVEEKEDPFANPLAHRVLAIEDALRLLKAQVSEANTSATEAKAHMTEIQAALCGTDIAAMGAAIKDIREQLSSLADKITTGVKPQRRQKMAWTQAEAARIAAIEAAIAALRGDLTALTARVTAVETRLGTADITAMAAAIASLQANVGAHNIADFDNWLVDLTRRVTAVEGTLTGANLGGHNVGNELTKLQTDVDEATKRARDAHVLATTAQHDATEAANQATAVRDALSQRIEDEIIPLLPPAGGALPAPSPSNLRKFVNWLKSN